MPAAVTDKFRKATSGTRPEAAYLTATKTIGASSITVNTTTGWATDTGYDFVIYRKDTSGNLVAGTVTTWVGTVSGTTVSNLTLKAGTDQEYASGELSVVVPTVSAAWATSLVEGALISLDQDGTLKAGAVDVPAVLASSVVETAKIADDAVTDAKLDYPRWWQEIGRTTLGSAGDTIAVSSIPARKYLRIEISGLNSGQIDPSITFNGDTGNNYALRGSNNGAADFTSASRGNWTLMAAGGSFPFKALIEITNISASEKIGTITVTEQNTAGAANVPGRTQRVGKWTNTSAQITSLTLLNSGTGDFASGSEVVVLGHD